MEIIKSLNENAKTLLATIATGIKVKVDTKDNTIKANIGVLLRKGLIVRTVCVGGNRYDAIEEVRKIYLKPQASSVKKASKKKSQVRNNFLKAEAIRFEATRFIGMMTASALTVKSEKMYNNNVCIAIDGIKKLQMVEFRSNNKIRVVTTSEDIKNVFMKFSGFTLKTSKSGSMFYIDCDISEAREFMIVRVLKMIK